MGVSQWGDLNGGGVRCGGVPVGEISMGGSQWTNLSLILSSTGFELIQNLPLIRKSTKTYLQQCSCSGPSGRERHQGAIPPLQEPYK